jgi:hypothetical protein
MIVYFVERIVFEHNFYCLNIIFLAAQTGEGLRPLWLLQPQGHAVPRLPALHRAFHGQVRVPVPKEFVDASNAALPDCVCGPGKGLAGLTCADCPASTYSATAAHTGSKPCQMCESGTYSGSGASECVDCPFGSYRLDTSILACQSCNAGYYSPDARYNFCIPCSNECAGGMVETPCPTDSSKLVCSPCPAVRPNAHLDGGQDCTSTCDAGYCVARRRVLSSCSRCLRVSSLRSRQPGSTATSQSSSSRTTMPSCAPTSPCSIPGKPPTRAN